MQDKAEAADELLELPLPYLETGRHLIDYLLEAGPVMPAGMGNSSLSWSELESWSRASGRHVSGWELRTLRYLSEVFLQQHGESSNPNCPSPWVEKADPDRREKVAQHVRSILRD